MVLRRVHKTEFSFYPLICIVAHVGVDLSKNQPHLTCLVANLDGSY